MSRAGHEMRAAQWARTRVLAARTPSSESFYERIEDNDRRPQVAPIALMPLAVPDRQSALPADQE